MLQQPPLLYEMCGNAFVSATPPIVTVSAKIWEDSVEEISSQETC